MFVFDCEAGYQPDNGQNDVTDGSVENYDFDWGQPLDRKSTRLNSSHSV